MLQARRLSETFAYDIISLMTASAITLSTSAQQRILGVKMDFFRFFLVGFANIPYLCRPYIIGVDWI